MFASNLANGSYARPCAPNLPVSYRPVPRIPETIIRASGMAGVRWGPAIPGLARERPFCPTLGRSCSVIDICKHPVLGTTIGPLSSRDGANTALGRAPRNADRQERQLLIALIPPCLGGTHLPMRKKPAPKNRSDVAFPDGGGGGPRAG